MTSPDDPVLPDTLARARALADPAAVAEHYAAWAERYDHDVFEVAGVTGTEQIAAVLAGRLSDRLAAVIDLGCGTGRAGVHLREQGFVTVDGIDLSAEMLDVARRTGAYRHLVVADLNGPLPLAPGTYDASIAAGLFTSGHLGAGAVASLVRLVRPGGVLAWVVADPVWTEVEPALRRAGAGPQWIEHTAIRRDGPPEARLVLARVAA